MAACSEVWQQFAEVTSIDTAGSRARSDGVWDGPAAWFVGGSAGGRQPLRG